MAQTGIPVWSQTAASNSNADSDINWAEGQSPSSVNNSARAMMAAVAKWRDDNAGTLTTGGTTTAYTVTSNQTFDSLSAMNGQTLRLKFNAANGASPTLNVDGLGAKSIVTSAGTAIGTGAILANTVYDLVYSNADSGAWFLVGGVPVEFPSGTVMLFRQTSAPSGWTKDTSNYNNHAIRVVTGTPSSGGATGFTSVFAARTITQGNLPSYNLSAGSLTVSGSVTFNGQSYVTDELVALGSSGINNMQRANNATGLTASFSGTIGGNIPSGGSGTAMDFAVLYVDVIFATKA